MSPNWIITRLSIAASVVFTQIAAGAANDGFMNWNEVSNAQECDPSSQAYPRNTFWGGDANNAIPPVAGDTVISGSDLSCEYDCRSDGCFFNIEFVCLDVFQQSGHDIASQLVPLQNPGATQIDELNPQFDSSIRISIGWQSDDSWGIRSSYWEFDTFASEALPFLVPNTPDLAIHSWRINVFDLELAYNDLKFNHWDTTVSAGYRFVHYEEDGILLSDGVRLASAETRYTGNGITGAVEARRHLRPQLVALANTRLTLVGGPENITITGIAPPDAVGQHGDARFIYEVQFAAEFIRPIWGGGYYYIRGGVEAQCWNEFSTPVQPIDRADILLAGFTFSVGLQR